MTERFAILVVCVGNVCRSPLAERLLAARLPVADFEVASAGVGAMVGYPVETNAARELARLGGDGGGFAARQFSAAVAEHADLVLTATREIREQVVREVPRLMKRAFTLRELATLVEDPRAKEAATSPRDLVRAAARLRAGVPVPDHDVPDPMGQSEAVHREVADLLDTTCRTIADALLAAR
jgi:protein-tyrosine phosphatase